jgi:hypothetical protein
MLHSMQRKTVNLPSRVAAALEPYLETGTPERQFLEEAAGEQLDSESEVLRALLMQGIWVIQDRQMEVGYAAWAAEWTEEDEAWAVGSARDAARQWADEP